MFYTKIAIARLIQYTSNRININKKKVQQILPFIIVSVNGTFGLITTTLSVTTNITYGFYKATEFVAQYVQNTDGNGINHRIDNKITVISNPLFFWIYRYVFNLDYYKKVYSDYPNELPVKTKNVVLIADPEFKYYMLHGYDPIPELQE